MNYILKITAKAHEDIKNIYSFIKKENEATAKKQAGIIYDALENLALFPNSGKSLNGFIRTKTAYRFTVIKKIYVAFYVAEESSVKVLRVFRAQQDYITQLDLTK